MSLSIKHRNETFKSIQEKLPKSRREVYQTIKELGMTSLDTVCFNLNKSKNELSGRITELKLYGFIREAGKGISERSNQNVTIYTVTTREEQINIINANYQSLVDNISLLEDDYHRGLSNYGCDVIKLQIKKIRKKIEQLSKYAS